MTPPSDNTGDDDNERTRIGVPLPPRRDADRSDEDGRIRAVSALAPYPTPNCTGITDPGERQCTYTVDRRFL